MRRAVGALIGPNVAGESERQGAGMTYGFSIQVLRRESIILGIYIPYIIHFRGKKNIERYIIVQKYLGVERTFFYGDMFAPLF